MDFNNFDLFFGVRSLLAIGFKRMHINDDDGHDDGKKYIFTQNLP